jgi:RNA polymerase sigma-70 factor, ECF subfamily
MVFSVTFSEHPVSNNHASVLSPESLPAHSVPTRDKPLEGLRLLARLTRIPLEVSRRQSATLANEVEPEVVRAAVAGSPAAQRVIFDCYARHVFRLAYRMTADRPLAEDLTQETFIRVFDRLHQYRGDARLGTWIHTIGASVILNGMRARSRFTTRERPIEDAATTANRASAMEADERDGVRAALDALPSDDRLLIVMYEVEGYTHKEVAAALGISPGACRMRLGRLRDALRARLSRFRER